jgi:hypothetical protein
MLGGPFALGGDRSERAERGTGPSTSRRPKTDGRPASWSALVTPSANSSATVPAKLPELDDRGRYRAAGEMSYTTLSVYVLLILVLYFVVRPSPAVAYPQGIDAVIAITLFLLARSLSTSYSIDDVHLRAWRIAGGRKVRLADVRKIELVRLRDLSPTGFFGSWGWRGRMWSPVIGPFDAVYTDPAGLLITAGDVPMFISPRHAPDFARELSRRVRSYTGPLDVDAGRPENSF